MITSNETEFVKFYHSISKNKIHHIENFLMNKYVLTHTDRDFIFKNIKHKIDLIFAYSYPLTQEEFDYFYKHIDIPLHYTLHLSFSEEQIVHYLKIYYISITNCNKQDLEFILNQNKEASKNIKIYFTDHAYQLLKTDFPII